MIPDKNELPTSGAVGLPQLVLHLVLTFDWYDETVEGQKRIEYRVMTERWKKQIWDRRDEITHVRFARGYTATMKTFEVVKIDKGDCPIHGWDDKYFRIHFRENAEAEGRPATSPPQT